MWTKDELKELENFQKYTHYNKFFKYIGGFNDCLVEIKEVLEYETL